MSIDSINSVITFAFVVSSMYGLGLGLTIDELLRPLKNLRLVIAVLTINFILLPGLTWLLITFIPLEASLKP